MPPRSALTSSFPVSDGSNEVVCPLENQDGSTCRKRCFGEKRYRSMQEHIRRAHPDYYLPKLPATEESFSLMVNSTPSKKVPTDTFEHTSPNIDHSTYDVKPFFSPDHSSATGSPTLHHSIRRPSMLPAATALAQLHNSRPDEWQTDHAAFPVMDNDSYLQSYFASPSAAEVFPSIVAEDTSPHMSRDVALNSLHHSLSARAGSLQPPFRPRGYRPRKTSVTENARRPKHQRDRSKDFAKRLSMGFDRKTTSSAEPSYMGNKWEDLLDAAATASEAEGGDSRDLTPIPQSPRSSATPLHAIALNASFQSYAASPLQNSLLPQSPEPEPVSFTAPHLRPFPSVEGTGYTPQPQDTTSSAVHQPSYHHLHHSSNASANSNPFSTFPHPHHQQHSSGSSFHLQSNFSSSPNQNLALTNATSYSTNNTTGYPIQYSPVQQSQHISPTMTQLNHSHDHDHISPTMTQLNHAHAHAHPHQQNHNHSHNHSHTHSQTSQQAPPAGSPPQTPPLVQHYCAACHRVAPLTSSYACTECICGICRDCVEVLVGMGPERGARCPRCKVVGGRFKPFMLDLR